MRAHTVERLRARADAAGMAGGRSTLLETTTWRSRMCSNCQGDGIDRRNVLKLGASRLVAIALDGGLSSVRAADAPPTALTPDEALNALKTGHERYSTLFQLCTLFLA